MFLKQGISNSDNKNSFQKHPVPKTPKRADSEENFQNLRESIAASNPNLEDGFPCASPLKHQRREWNGKAAR